MLRSGFQIALIALALTLTPGTALPDEAVDEPFETHTEFGGDEEYSVSFVVPFENHDDGNVRRFRLLDFWIVKFVDMESRKDPEYYRLDVVDVPLVTLFSRERDEDKTSTSLLTLPGFALFRNKTRGDTHVDRQFLKLPLIGSLFRYRRTPRETRTEILFLMRFSNRHSPEADTTGGTETDPETQ